MALKKLTQFIKFDWQEFAKGKKFMVIGCRPWKDYDTQKVQGTAVDVVIVVDNTAYSQKENEQVTNLYEKLTFKIKKSVSIPINTQVVPAGVTAVVYGDYRNLLSTKVEELQVVSTQSQAAQR